jgi:mannose-1-phosphate guanylyltransferase / mannose-6-phosphate isomerase
MKLLPVILSGGSGTRLWPVSREALPKPFMRVAGGKSLLQRTFERANRLPDVVATAVVTNLAYSYKTAEELMNERAADSLALLLEPAGRNTAPAVAVAALWAKERFGDDAVLLVLPADHLIGSEEQFLNTAQEAAQLAARGDLVLFGIRPSGPETGFGYIECGARLDRSAACKVMRFIEKPSLEKATEYLANGNFVWNSGMFCFTVDAILRAMERYAPDVMSAAKEVIASTDVSGPQVILDSASFARLPNISIDYAVMERADRVTVIPCEFGWNDIGSWKAVAETLTQDEFGNSTEGNAVLVNSRRTYVRSENRLVAAVGVEDLVIVDTPDAVLVAHKESSQQVKDIVAKLREQGNLAATEHRTVDRPWGTYTTIVEGAGYKVKRITVRPNCALSLQYHHKRAEHWVVVGGGTALVQIGDQEFQTRAGEYRYIPLGEKHRLSNVGSEPLELIEVQCGTYLGEDDIVRLVDNYGRA